MRLQVNILFRMIKKNYKWFVFFILLSFLSFMLLKVGGSERVISERDFFMVIGYPTSDISFIDSLIYLYQYILIFYIVYIFCSDDIFNSFENIILRINSKRWIILKSCLVVFFVFLFKITQYLLVFIYNGFSFDLIYLVNSIVFSLLIGALGLVNFSFSKKWFYFLGIGECILVVALFYKFNLVVSLSIIIFAFIYSVCNFNFKKYLNNN